MPDDGEVYTVDHINRVHTDNWLNNLRWATMAEQNANREAAFAFLDNPEDAPNAVYAIAADGTSTAYRTAAAACEELGLDPGNVARVLNPDNAAQTTGGYTFEYVTPREPDQLDGEMCASSVCKPALFVPPS